MPEDRLLRFLDRTHRRGEDRRAGVAGRNIRVVEGESGSG
jgi:hypothetical protein